MNILSIKQKQKGVTLLELLLYVSMVGAMLFVIFMFFFSIVEMRVRNEMEKTVERESILALDVIRTSLRDAILITDPEVGEISNKLSIHVLRDDLVTTEKITFYTNPERALMMDDGSYEEDYPLTSKRVLVDVEFVSYFSDTEERSIGVELTVSGYTDSMRSERLYTKKSYATITLKK